MEIHIQRREEALKAYRDQPRYPRAPHRGRAANLRPRRLFRKFQCVVMSALPVQGTQYRLAPRSVTALFLRIDPCYGSSEPTASGL